MKLKLQFIIAFFIALVVYIPVARGQCTPGSFFPEVESNNSIATANRLPTGKNQGDCIGFINTGRRAAAN
jgi:hypothetical protein